MKLENSIGWCDATTNAVTGCDKVSPGCKNCYAEAGTRARVLRAQGKETWGTKGVREPVNFEPVFRRLDNLWICDNCHECYQHGNDDCPKRECFDSKLRRIRLFADSNSDWLDPKWPIGTLARFLGAIRLAPNVDVQLLTKRIELFQNRLLSVEACLVATWLDDQREGLLLWIDDWMKGHAPKHVWLGVSVEDQKRVDERIPMLLKTPAAIRFLSVEPLLESTNLFQAFGPSGNPASPRGVDWVIVGGESGKNRRDCGVEVIESVVLQCANAGVPVYCKQDVAFKSSQKGRLSDNAWSFKQFPVAGADESKPCLSARQYRPLGPVDQRRQRTTH
jgi:protein gp37